MSSCIVCLRINNLWLIIPFIYPFFSLSEKFFHHISSVCIRETSNFICMFRMANSITENKIMILRFTFVFFFYFVFFHLSLLYKSAPFCLAYEVLGVYGFCFFIYEYIFVGCNTRCIPFSVICFLSRSGMTSDGYRRGYVSFAHFCYICSSVMSLVNL